MNNRNHEYVPAQLGHSSQVCKWCAGTPAENSVIAPAHCDMRPVDDGSASNPEPTMDEVTPEMLALARQCAAKYWQTGDPGDGYAARMILSGEWDGEAYVQAALAAIKETSERAANWMPAAYFPTDYIHRQAQRALRNLEHLK